MSEEVFIRLDTEHGSEWHDQLGTTLIPKANINNNDNNNFHFPLVLPRRHRRRASSTTAKREKTCFGISFDVDFPSGRGTSIAGISARRRILDSFDPAACNG